MKQKSAVIFGGTRGIGRVIAEHFVTDGYQVTIVARTNTQVAEAARILSEKGSAMGIVADVSEPREVREAIDRHMQAYTCLDAVVMASGIQGPIGRTWETDPAVWRRTLMVNLLGCYNVSHAVLPLLMDRKGGSLIFFSGGGAAYARPRFSAYGCSKTGVLRLAETIHEELLEDSNKDDLETGIRIYAIAPGAVKTKMTDEVIASGGQAGGKAYQEALKTSEEGGTPPGKAAELCFFLAEERPMCLSGRLIHVNEPYREYVSKFEGKDIGDSGLLRRQPYRVV